jgi:hypothetical protein
MDIINNKIRRYIIGMLLIPAIMIICGTIRLYVAIKELLEGFK